MALTAKMAIELNIAYSASRDLADTQHPIILSRGPTLKSAEGAGNDDHADVVWDDQRTLADTANETLDLQDGSLTDNLGNAVTIDILKALYIKNTSTDASLLIGGAAATQLGLFNDVSDVLKLQPGGEILLTAPLAAGIDTTTNSDLKLAHDGTGSSDLVYDIVVVGED